MAAALVLPDHPDVVGACLLPSLLYCLWRSPRFHVYGAAVLVAEHMEHTARGGAVHCSDAARDAYAAAATFPINAATTLYAQWTPNATYTVTYNGAPTASTRDSGTGEAGLQ